VRYVTLTWNCHNIYADSALFSVNGETFASTPKWHGISPAGDALIKEMNRLGMLVDLSHVSKNTMIDVLGGNPAKTTGSLAPPIFSHSSVFSICPHPRNVPDDVLQLVKKRNSLVMINFSPDFISCVASNVTSELPDSYPANFTLAQVVRHITYVGDSIGYDHVGIGTDYDGIESTPRGLEDVSKFPDLVAALLEAGVSDDDAAKVVGRNLLRVWAEADEVSKKLKKTALPLEDDLPGWNQV
jgi:membrane dipeptidase